MALTTDLYTGSFKRRNAFYNLPSPLHVADPAHNEPGVFEGENAYTYTEPGNALPLSGDESWGSGYVISDYSRPLDATPYDTAYGPDVQVEHTDGIELGVPGGGQDQAQWENFRFHSEDLGATVQQNYGIPSLQFQGEKYEGIDFESEGNSFAEGIPALAGGGQRGLNSLNENNPPLEMYDGEGYRRGHVNWWRADRKFNARIIQRHDLKWLTDNVAYGPPVNQQATGTPDGMNLPTFARMFTGRNQTPQNRETPETPDAYITYTGDTDSPTFGAGF